MDRRPRVKHPPLPPMDPPTQPNDSWGPSNRQRPPRRARRAPRWMWALFAAVYFSSVADGSRAASGLVVLTVIGLGAWRLARASRGAVRRVRGLLRRAPGWSLRRPAAAAVAAPVDALRRVLGEVARLGGGVYLGSGARGGWRCARPERAALILGPPRSGKTTSVMIPAVIAHHGAVVSTSTKPDVLAATARSRGHLGPVWQFDPTGAGAVAVVEQLRWSPVTCGADWDGALLMSRAMVSGAGVGAGVSDQSHWARRAQALLASLLHAAAVGGVGID